MNNPAYVYFAHHQTEPRFKIGKALSPMDRLSVISRNNKHGIDANRTFAVEVVNEKDAFRVETLFHSLLLKYTYPKELCGDDGKTEWFHSEAYEVALRSAKSIQQDASFVLIEDWGKRVIGQSLPPQNLTDRILTIIEKQRILNNLTQKQFAEKLGVPLPTYRNYIKKGRRNNLSELPLLWFLGLSAPIEELLKKYESVEFTQKKRVRHKKEKL